MSNRQKAPVLLRKSRTRSRLLRHQKWVKFHTVVGQTPNPATYVNYNICTSFEQMDENSAGKQWENYVVHYKHDYTYHVSSFSGISPPNGNAHMIYVNEYWALLPFANGGYILRPTAVPYRDYSLKDFASKVLNIGDVNLLDLLRTLKQIPELITKFSARLDKLHLAIQYGWGPLFKDLAAIRDIIADGAAEWERLLSLQGKTISVNLGPFTENRIVKQPIPGQFSTHEFVLKMRIKHSASCDVVIGNIPPNGLGNILHQLDRLGLGRWASTAWEAIPGSFLIDWFFKVNEILGQFDTILQSPDMTFYNFCRSAKVTDAEFKVITTGDTMFSPPVMIGNKIVSGKLSLYKREPFFASTPIHVPLGTGLNSESRKKTLLALGTSTLFK